MKLRNQNINISAINEVVGEVEGVNNIMNNRANATQNPAQESHQTQSISIGYPPLGGRHKK